MNLSGCAIPCDVIHALGWTLIHSLWQAGCILLILVAGCTPPPLLTPAVTAPAPSPSASSRDFLYLLIAGRMRALAAMSATSDFLRVPRSASAVPS